MHLAITPRKIPRKRHAESLGDALKWIPDDVNYQHTREPSDFRANFVEGNA